jgi:hypothetical protein
MVPPFLCIAKNYAARYNSIVKQKRVTVIAPPQGVSIISAHVGAQSSDHLRGWSSFVFYFAVALIFLLLMAHDNAYEAKGTGA